jgi:hypothetical protein
VNVSPRSRSAAPAPRGGQPELGIGPAVGLSRRSVALAVAVLLAAASLVSGAGGGLARLGAGGFGAAALAHHGALMVCGFFGTLIALERAAALRVGHVVPVLAGGGAVLLMVAGVDLAALAWFGAGIGLVALYAYAGRRRAWSLHLGVEMAGAACWPLGTLAWWRGDVGAATLAWMAFLLLTIAGERRELAQFVRLSRVARAGFVGAVAFVIAATLWRLADPAHDAASRAVWWAGAAALGVWLLRVDIAPRHWNAPGWRGHTARCLSLGYAWLLVACALQFTGAAVAATHALLLGFVFSMVFGHAPIMLPALAHLQPAFTRWAQLPLVLMGASVALRIAGQGAGQAGWLRAAGIGHAAAIVLFALVMAGAVLRGRAAAAARARA